MARTWGWISSVGAFWIRIVGGLRREFDLTTRCIFELRMGYAFHVGNIDHVLCVRVRDLYVAKLCTTISIASCMRVSVFVPFCRLANLSS
jgi:hypothetical protein